MIVKQTQFSFEINTFEKNFAVDIDQKISMHNYNEVRLNNVMFINNIYNMADDISIELIYGLSTETITIKQENLSFDVLLQQLNENTLNIIFKEYLVDSLKMRVHRQDGADFQLIIEDKHQTMFGNIEKVDTEYISTNVCNLVANEIITLRSNIIKNSTNEQDIVKYINLEDFQFGSIVKITSNHNYDLNNTTNRFYFYFDFNGVFECEEQFFLTITLIEYKFQFIQDIFNELVLQTQKMYKIKNDK